jgi:hypothetical protein
MDDHVDVPPPPPVNARTQRQLVNDHVDVVRLAGDHVDTVPALTGITTT